MKLQQITQRFVLAFFFVCLVCITQVANAELLSFKPGHKASYTISQTLFAELSHLGETVYCQSEATMDLDIEILSTNEETGSYPFEVKLSIQKLLISELQQNGLSSTTIRYNSHRDTPPENHLLATHLDTLINAPLHFKVEKDFEVKETTGLLAKMNAQYDSPSELGLFGTTPWTFELLLTQLFHLSGQDLLPAQTYPVSCYHMIEGKDEDWEDSSEDESEILLQQTSAYVVHSVKPNNISASWQANAQVTNRDEDYVEESSVEGSVTWDLRNPLIQERHLTFKSEQNGCSLFPFRVKTTMQQTWKPLL